MRATLYSKTETRHFKNCYVYSISKITSDTRLRQVLSLTNCEVQTWVIVVKVISCCRLEAFIYLLTNSSATSLKQQARIQILPYIDIHNLILSQWLSKQSGGRHDSRGRHYSRGRHDFVKLALNIGTSLIVAQIKLLTKKPYIITFKPNRYLKFCLFEYCKLTHLSWALNSVIFPKGVIFH